ncbi:aminotransferase class V-fold PLP-dependent enzyme, partial [Staphylococcus epidermidis]|uniref:aminotransferase class V-fold PLP-dependent enzyme n=1 Tax=Staphylococcus epidermidis TaxID=1282 RepID=UPI0011A89650
PNHIITSLLQHPSLFELITYFQTQKPFKLKYLHLTKQPNLHTQHLKSLITHKVPLLTSIYLNNIMPQIQPIQEIANILKNYPPAHFHVHA